MKIKKGDNVIVLAGKDRGKSGTVLQVFPDHNRVSVEGINILHKNVRAKRQGETGQRIEFPSPMQSSNLALLCPKCGKRIRVGYRVTAEKTKIRVCRKCHETI